MEKYNLIKFGCCFMLSIIRSIVNNKVFCVFTIVFSFLLGFSGSCTEENKEKNDVFKTPILDRSNLKTECDEISSIVALSNNFCDDLQSEEENINRSITPNSIDVEFGYDTLSSEDSDEGSSYFDESDKNFAGDENPQIIEELNERIKRKEGSENNYPNLYIAHYRGLHYLRDRFQTPHTRHVHIKTSHVKQTTHSPAIYYKTCIGFSTPQPLKQQMSTSVDELTVNFEKMSIEKVVPSYWSKDILFSSPERRLHQRLSNSYDGFHNDIMSGIYIEELQGMNSPESPYVAAADGPYHALRYAFGLKLPKCQRSFVFSPNYRNGGKPKHSKLGKVLVFIHSLPEYANADASHIPSLGALGEINPQTRALDESETTFKTFVAGKYIILEEIAKVPSLVKYKSYYKQKYGLTDKPIKPNAKKRDLNSFYTWKHEILEKAATEQQKSEAENEFMDRIARYQARRIFRKAKEYINQVVNGKLVYQKVPYGYSLYPADLKEARKLHKRNFPKLQAHLKSKLALILSKKPQASSTYLSSISKELFPSINPQFYYENNPRYYFKTSDDLINSIHQRFLSHRNNKYIRRLLMGTMKNDLHHIKPFFMDRITVPIADNLLMDRNVFKFYFKNIKKWKGNRIDRQTLEVLSHIWNFGERTLIKIYKQSKESPNKLEWAQGIGSDKYKGFLCFLKIDERNDSYAEYIPLQYMRDYKGTEIFDDFSIEKYMTSKNGTELGIDQPFDKKDLLFKWADQTGTQRTFRESYVDGSQGNCGFTAIGIDREEAIKLLIKNTENPETQRLIAPEIRALITVPEEGTILPSVLQELRQHLYYERRALVEQLETRRRCVNETLLLNENDGLTFQGVQEHIHEHKDQFEWWQTFIENFESLQSIDHKIDNFIPSSQQLSAFVEYEFGERHAYLSYFRDGGGALEAIARLLGVEVTVLEGSNDLNQVLYVPPALGNNHRYFLHHVGGVDEKGRGFLNHFNLLEEIKEPIIGDQTLDISDLSVDVTR